MVEKIEPYDRNMSVLKFIKRDIYAWLFVYMGTKSASGGQFKKYTILWTQLEIRQIPFWTD